MSEKTRAENIQEKCQFTGKRKTFEIRKTFEFSFCFSCVDQSVTKAGNMSHGIVSSQ